MNSPKRHHLPRLLALGVAAAVVVAADAAGTAGNECKAKVRWLGSAKGGTPDTQKVSFEVTSECARSRGRFDWGHGTSTQGPWALRYLAWGEANGQKFTLVDEVVSRGPMLAVKVFDDTLESVKR